MTQELAIAPVKTVLKREDVNSCPFKNIHEAIAGIDYYIRWYYQERISSVA